MHARPAPRFLTSVEVAAAGGAPGTLARPDAGAAPRRAGEVPARRRVLVIDDDEALLEVVRELLGTSGFEVEVARHGFLAGYLVGHCRPDAVVLDIMMPGLDGYEVLSLLRLRPEARAIPVVACTSLQGAEAEARIRGAGFDAYVRKPIEFRELLRTLDELTGRDRAGGDPGGAPLPA